MRLLYIKPTFNSAENRNISDYLNQYREAGTEISV